MALEWAAAEASARECELRIVNVFNRSPSAVDVYGAVPMVIGNAAARGNAAAIVNQAADRARTIDSRLRITTHVREGSIG
jgi:hypothetical protein